MDFSSVRDLLGKVNVFKHRDGSVLGIDIGSSAIKVVQLRRAGGRAVLETYGELALGPYAEKTIGQATNLTPDILAEALTDVLNEANTTTNISGISIPFSSSLVTFLKLPPLSDDRLEKMIPIEARKYIPVPISEVTLDWFVVPEMESRDDTGERAPERGRRQQKNTNVLLVAIHNETLQKYQQLVRTTGLSVSFYEIEIFASSRSILDRGLAPVMIFDMGAASTKLYVVERGIVRLSHNIKKGSQDITVALSKSQGISMQKAEELKREHGLVKSDADVNPTSSIMLTTDYIFSEANRVLLNYQKKYNKNISKVILTGGGALLKGLSSQAHEKMDAEVSFADPFAKVEAPAFLEDTLKEAGPAFANAVGLALRKLYENE